MICRLLSLALLALAACSDIPKDPERTLDRIRGEQQFRVGLVAPRRGEAESAVEKTFVARVAKATHARPTFVSGAVEPLLLSLEDGELDLVIGAMAPDSPWIPRVAMLPPLLEQTRGRHLLLSPMARNGENAWIMLLEREARATRADSGA